MTLGQLRNMTELMPDDTEIFVHTRGLVHRYSDASGMIAAAVKRTHREGPQPDPYTKEEKPKFGVFIR